jgi:pimeloyl-ACP methyl ester carboxylesterase
MNRSILSSSLFSIAILLSGSGCRSVQQAAFAPHRTIAPTDTTIRPSSSSATATATENAAGIAAKITEVPSRWPSRWGDDPDRPGTVIDLDPAEPLRPIHLSRYHQFRSTDIEYNDANQLATDLGLKSGFKFKAEGPGSFLFIPNPKNESTPDFTKDSGKQSPADTPDLAFKFVSATPIPTLPDASEPKEDHVVLQRTWFTYRDPKSKNPSVDPLGTIVLLPGMFGTPDVIIDGLETYWHTKGYAVLRMRSQPSRFTRHEMIPVVLGQEQSIANHAAKIFDDGVAEGAYATKAALDHLQTLRPDLASKPTILIGMSGGAMMLPTVYAYAPDHYNAAVLIAGGADFLRIAIESNYKDWIDAAVFDFKPADPDTEGNPTAEEINTLSMLYLDQSRLDAYHTATEMGDIPLLMLHGTIDQAVPSVTGQLLYRQLGEPERWSYPVGHELIFIGLPTQVARIDKWITEHVLDLAEKD